MKSTDNNINNPTSVSTIELLRKVESWQLPRVVYLTREMYDLQEIKDPLILYVITDSKNGECYYGEARLEKEKIAKTYYMSVFYDHNVNEYVYPIYMNRKDGVYGSDNMIELCRFGNPADAIEAVQVYNALGTHETVALSIATLITSYLDDCINLHDVLVGIFVIAGYKNHPDMQKLLQTVVTYSIAEKNMPGFFNDEISNLRKVNPSTLIAMFADLYDVFVKHNFMNDCVKEGQITMETLNPAVQDIMTVIEKYR